jgi:hypothetical protein
LSDRRDGIDQPQGAVCAAPAGSRRAVHGAVYNITMQIREIDHLSLAEVEDQLRRGARFVHFEYCVSLLVFTWRMPTDIFLLAPGQRGVFRSWPYLLVTILFGWWGLPWGLFLTPQVLYINLCGGKDVTAEVWAFLQVTHAAESEPGF